MLYGQDLRFDNDRLTVSASVASSYWKCNASASLARFPCKLDLMPVRRGLCKRTSAGLGRHCFASDDWFQPVLLCGLSPRPLASITQSSFFSNSNVALEATADSPKSVCSCASFFSLSPACFVQDVCPCKLKLFLLLDTQGLAERRETGGDGCELLRTSVRTFALLKY